MELLRSIIALPDRESQRKVLEREEKLHLAPYALKASEAKRVHPEEPPPFLQPIKLIVKELLRQKNSRGLDM